LLCKKNFRTGEKGKAEISVFLALVFVLVASLVLASVEMLRTQAATTYLKIAADSAVDSLFSQYHLDLWNEYRLLGLEMYAPAEITDEYYGFLEPYLDTANTWNWFGHKVEKEDLRVNEYKLLTDDNGYVFEKEVRDYMTFGIVLDAAGLAEREGLQDTIDSAKSTVETAEQLTKSSKKAEWLEKRLNTLSATVTQHNSLVKQMNRALADGNGNGVRILLSQLRTSLATIQKDAEKVGESTEELRTDMADTRTDLRQKLSDGKITLSDYDQMEYRIGDFDSYTQLRGEKNRELQRLLQNVQKNSEKLDAFEEEANAARDYIDNWVPEQILVRYDPPLTEGGEPVPVYEEEVLDETEVWKEAKDCFASYGELNYTSENGEVDEEKANQFTQISNLLSGSLIELVFPGGSKISGKEHDLKDAPSAVYCTSDTNVFSSADYLLNKLAVDEYAMMELTNVLSTENEISAAEVEYVLWGNKTDKQNVSAVAAELIAVRSGLNLAYLFTDAEKLKTAGALAASISGGASGTPIVLVVTFLILSVWAGAQAVIDTRQLFQGGKVPLIHTKESFGLSAEDLLTNFQGVLNSDKKSDTGLEYRDYLKMFLFSRSGSRTDYRIMDVIQENLKRKQTDFLVNRLYVSMDMTVNSRSEHIFSDLLGGGLGDYTLEVNTAYGYS